MSRVSSAGSGRTSIGLVQFPGSNCDMDCIDTLKRHFNIVPKLIWHSESTLPPVDAIVLPGGFSFGDYLRSGALASHSPVMAAVKEFVKKGGAVLGICNGFQVLTESRILPGALLRNAGRKFICDAVTLATGTGTSTYQKTLAGKTTRVPIAHGEGRYFIDQDGLKHLKGEGLVAFRYVGSDGRSHPAANPNGSLDDIAGVVSPNGRVLGMMPHPERATDELMGGSRDGLPIWEAFLASVL